MHFFLGCLLACCIHHHVNCDIGCTEERTAKGPSAKRSRSVVVKAKTRAALAYTRVVRSRSVCGCNWPRAKCLVVQCKSTIWTSFMSPFLPLPSFLPLKRAHSTCSGNFTDRVRQSLLAGLARSLAVADVACNCKLHRIFSTRSRKRGILNVFPARNHGKCDG